jgi:hypothetical protein
VKCIKIAHKLVEALLETTEDDGLDWAWDAFQGDLLDVSSTREEKKKKYWNDQVNALIQRVRGGEFDGVLEDLFTDWKNTGFKKAFETTEWASAVAADMDVSGFTDSDAHKWSLAHHKPKPIDTIRAPGGYFPRTLESLITHHFANDVWAKVLRGLRGNPQKWSVFHFALDHAGEWLRRNGYVTSAHNENKMKAKQAIEQVVEDNGSDFEDLMRVDIFTGFQNLDKESLILAEWNKPMNLPRGVDRRTMARVVNTVEGFIISAGRALQKAGYSVMKAQEFEDETGEFRNTETLDSMEVLNLAVDWASKWMVREGHIRPEDVAPLKAMFS